MRCSPSCKKQWGTMDFLVHAIGFSDKNELKGRYADTTRANFQRTMVISCFSFTEAAKRAAALMPNGGSMVTLTYNGGDRAMPNYNVMGVAKAGLEASVRYLAVDFGPQKIRVNAISAGPIRTLAGAGINDARYMFAFQQRHSPLGRGVTLDDLGGAGLYLLSELSGGVTGEIHFVEFRLQHHRHAAAGCAALGGRRDQGRRAVARSASPQSGLIAAVDRDVRNGLQYPAPLAGRGSAEQLLRRTRARSTCERKPCRRRWTKATTGSSSAPATTAWCSAGISPSAASTSCWWIAGCNTAAGCRPQEVTKPGFYHNLHSINHFHISETPWFKDLDLADRVTYITPRYELGQPHLDGTALVFGRDLEETLANVARFSKKDAADLPRLEPQGRGDHRRASSCRSAMPSRCRRPSARRCCRAARSAATSWR